MCHFVATQYSGLTLCFYLLSQILPSKDFGLIRQLPHWNKQVNEWGSEYRNTSNHFFIHIYLTSKLASGM